MLSREIGRALSLEMRSEEGYKPQISKMNTDLGLGLPGGFTSWLVDVALPNTGFVIQSVKPPFRSLASKGAETSARSKASVPQKIRVHL